MTLESLREQMLLLGETARHILRKTVLDKSRKRSFRDRENYRTELVQVAAVAVAAITDLDMAGTGLSQILVEEQIWSEILDERDRQDKKFQRQLPIGLDPLIWGAVLVEEVAEVLKEVE